MASESSSGESLRPVEGWQWVTSSLHHPSKAVRSGFEDLFRANDINPALASDHARITAFHESCHAVGHLLVGSELVSVSIVPVGRVAGVTQPNNDTISNEQGLVTSLAGVFASALTEPNSNLVQSIMNDIGQAVFYAIKGWGKPNGVVDGMFGLEVKPGHVATLLASYWTTACDLLGDPSSFHKVRVVANTLIKQG